YDDEVIFIVDLILALHHGTAGVRGQGGRETQERRSEEDPEASGRTRRHHSIRLVRSDGRLLTEWTSREPVARAPVGGSLKWLANPARALSKDQFRVTRIALPVIMPEFERQSGFLSGVAAHKLQLI